MDVTIVRGHADRIWTVRPGAVTWRSIEDETVLLDTTDALYLVLNHTASVMWAALESGATTDELATLLVERIPVIGPSLFRSASPTLPRHGLFPRSSRSARPTCAPV